ncbi:MAG TPA: zinc ribbon domain-containing protein [Pyrinomonadaceae bacterium]|nr:zinc ribbon domain-containing protein [Pyrinomonadaceae bacterium]
MYCPQCGQQQISESTRFCSRCGLLVSGLPEWIARGGMVPLAPLQQPGPKPSTPKRKGIRRGAKLMFISGVAFPIFLGMSIAADFPGPLLVPFTLFFAGLAILLYSVIFGDDTPITTGQLHEPSRLGGIFGNNALPPAPANVQMNTPVAHAVRTSELVGPPSVTENTTRLLDRE